jgi:hypothetical protein
MRKKMYNVDYCNCYEFCMQLLLRVISVVTRV